MHGSTRIAAAVALLAFGLPAGAATAAPLDARKLPAYAKCVVHLDLDAARGTRSAKLLGEMAAASPELRKQLDSLSATFGMASADDLHDVTGYSDTAVGNDVTMVVRGKVDHDKFVASIKAAGDFATSTAGKYDVMSGTTKDGRRMFVAFHDPETFVAGSSADRVRAGLDAIDGKGDPLPADSLLLTPTPPTTRPAGAAPSATPSAAPLFVIAFTDVPSITKGAGDVPPGVKQVQATRLTVAEVGPNLAVTLEAVATTPDAAEQLKRMADGLRAMAAFGTDPDKADPQSKIIAAAVTSASLVRTGNTVSGQISIPMDVVEQAAKNGQLRATAAGGPTTRPGVSVNVEVETHGPTTHSAK